MADTAIGMHIFLHTDQILKGPGFFSFGHMAFAAITFSR
jgi:hypothetical protein